MKEGDGEEVEVTETWEEGRGSSSIRGLPPFMLLLGVPPPPLLLLLLVKLLLRAFLGVMVTVESLLPEGNDNEGILTLTQLGLLSSCCPRRSSC